MAAYTIASDIQPSGVGSAATASVKPSASVALSILDAYISHTDGAFAARCEIFRVTGGTATSSPTPDKVNRKSGANGATTSVNWSTDPTKSGNSLVILPFSVETNIQSNRRWMPPDPRNPLSADANGNAIELHSDSAGVIFDRSLTFAEPDQTFRQCYGRRYPMRRGRFQIQDEARNFGGLSTAPLHQPSAYAYTYIQPAAWDTPQQNLATQNLLLLNAAGGGTQFNQAVDGTLTSSGVLVKQTGKILAGTLTSSGTLLKQTGKILAGSMASSGAIQKQTGKVLAGSMASSGAIVKQTQKPLSGSMASSGALVKQTQKVLAGALTSAGALVKQAQKVLAGALTSSGLLVKQTNKVLAGTLTSSGALTAFKVALISLAGTLTSSGTLVKQTGKSLAGTLTSAGTIVKRTAKGLAGTLASAGALIAQKTATAVRKVFIFLFDD